MVSPSSSFGFVELAVRVSCLFAGSGAILTPLIDEGVFWIVTVGDVCWVLKVVPSFGLKVKYHWSPFVVSAAGTMSKSFRWDFSAPFLCHRTSVPDSGFLRGKYVGDG